MEPSHKSLVSGRRAQESVRAGLKAVPAAFCKSCLSVLCKHTARILISGALFVAVFVTAQSRAASPDISGTVADQPNSDLGSVQCFSGVTIGSTNSTVNVTIFLDVSAKGTFTNLDGFSHVGTNYVFNGTPANATAGIRGLYFVATPNLTTQGNSITTRMTISVDDGVATANDSTTTVITSYDNHRPAISGTHDNETTDKSTNKPFSGVLIFDQDSPPQNVTVTVTLDDTNKGSFTTLAGFSNEGGGVYKFTGTDAAATIAIRGLVFTPTPNRITPGDYETNRMTVSVSDGLAPASNDSDTTVAVLSINDPPTLTGVTSNRNISDKQTTNLFAGFSIGDVDTFGTQHVTVTIAQDDAAKGTIQVGSSGFTGGPVDYSFTGTPSDATIAIRALVFSPTENRKPVGTNETTSFQVDVTDASGDDAVNTPLTTTVRSLSINDPATITGVNTNRQILQTGRTNTPFPSVVISDVDVGDYTNYASQHVQLQVTFSGATGNGQWIAPPGYGFVSGNVYNLAFSTLADATFAIQHLTYQAQSFPLSGTNTVNFTIVATDDHNGGATNTDASVDIYTPYTPPGLTGTRSNQRVNDNATVALFSTVNIQSFNGGSFSVRIQLDSDTKGALVNLGSFIRSSSTSPATYTFDGTSEAATAAIRQLLFQPTPNRINGASTETTTFSITLVDGGVTNGPDTSTTVIVSPVNDVPTIQGISPLVTITDASTRNPFPTVLITDVDELGQQNQTVTVHIDDNAKGTFSTNSLALSGFATNGINFSRSGSPSNVTSAIRKLVFVPTAHRLPSGATENVVFSVTSDDGQGGVTVNNNTTIRVAALPGGPVISLPSPQPVSLPLAPSINPFSSATITDPQDVILTLGLTNSNWGSFTSNSLAANNFTNISPGIYQTSGNASNISLALQAVEFVPNTNLALGTVITFAINAVNQTGNATDAALAITLRLNQRSIIVTKTSDYDPGDLSVTDAQKGGTLRKAIQDAGSNDHITFDIRSGSPNLPDYPATIRVKSPLILNNNVVFDGPGADLLSISGDSDGDGAGDQEIFQVNAQVTVNRLTLTKGRHPFSGGAVEVNEDGDLTLSYCAVTDSRADVWGGGVDVNGGKLSMDHCLIAGNSTSSAFGKGGAGISLFTDQECDIVNCTFSANQQLAPSGLGGGAIYAETFDSGVPFDVLVLSCTFKGNSDAAGHGSSIRPNVFNTFVRVQNNIFADGQSKNLEHDQSGDIITLGGNISDDSTKTVFSIGGAPEDTSILLPPGDMTNTIPSLLPLANNLGPTFTHALGPTNLTSAGTNVAVNNSISNQPAATFFGTLGTDQRGYWRDGRADVGAFEANASKRVIIEEILFANTNNQFIEFYVPRDSAALNLGNFQVLVHGVTLHTFTNQNLNPGEALVLFASNAASKAVPTGVYSQVASNSVLMDPNADVITLVNPSNQVVLEVNYIGSFVSSDTSDPGYLSASGQSIVLSPQFQGCYLPYQRVVAKEGGRTPGGSELSSAGYDATGTPLAAGNAPPRAYDDLAATDAQTALPSLLVLSNDKDPDASDAIRVVGVGVTNGLQAGVSSLTSTSHFGAAVVVNSNGVSVGYNPRASAFLTSLPQGSNVVDWFQYTILDSSNGVDHARGTTAGEISNNIVKATATVSVNITGVNLAPTPQDDGTNTNPVLTVSEDGILDFTTADTILANDTDPNTDDNSSTLTIISIQPTNTYQNSIQTFSSLGAFVTLDIRFNRNQTHITYDPRSSPTLNSLAVGQTADDVFYYSVMDRYGAIGSAAVHITVIGANDTNTATADMLTADEDTAIIIPAATLLGNDMDPDTGIVGPVAPHLQISSVSPVSALGAQLQIVSGNVRYDPTGSPTLNALARKETILDTFTYTALDDYGASSNAVVTLLVSGRNDAPVPAPDFYSTGEKILLPVDVPGVLSNDHDPDVNGVAPDDTIRVIPFAGSSRVGAPVVMNANGSFSFDPRGVFDWLIQGQQTNDTFSYVLMDHSLSIANDDLFTVQGNSASNVLKVLANDALLSQVGGALTIVGVGAPNKAGTAAINSQGNALVYSPAANFVGVETVTYTISDGLGGTDNATVTIAVTVDPLNGNLVANNDSYTVARSTTVSLDVLANDGGFPGAGATFTILSVSAPDHGGSVGINGVGPNNSLTYAPNSANAFPLTETFSYVISAGGTARSTGVVSVALVDRANTLQINDDTFAVIANGANNPLDVLGNDLILPGPNTNLVITSIQTNGLGGTLSINSNRTGLLYRPPSGVTNHQEPNFTYTISDNAGGTATATVSIFVLANTSSGFFANEDVFSVTKNSQSNSLAVLLNDAILPNGGQNLIITDTGIGTNAPNQGGTVTIAPSAKVLTYTPANNFVGEETFTYEIGYGTSVRAQGRVHVRVVDTTTLPSKADYFNVAKNSANNSLAPLKNDYPLPKTLLSLKITGLQTNGARGTVVISGTGFNNSLLYTPANGFIGHDTFRYETSDGRGNTGTNSVTVMVGNLVPRDDQFSVLSGSANNALDVLANDPFLPDTTTVRPITGLGSPDHGGTIATNGGGTLVLYTPASGFIGTERFSYQIKDDAGGVFSANAAVEVIRAGSDRTTNTVTITVIGTNDPPTITGTRGSFQITDKETAALFPNVTIGDVDAFGLQKQAVTVSFPAPRGFLSQLGGFIQTAPGVYAITGTPPVVTTALRGLIYNPIENRITVGTNEVTTFTISVNDFYVSSPVVDASTTLTVVPVNDPPIISGTVSNQTVYEYGSLRPFSGVTITEVDDLTLQPLRITVTLDNATHGTLTSLGGFVSAGGGVYTLGTPGAGVTAAAATTALRGLVFVPTTGGRAAPGSPDITRFTITVDDGFASPVNDSRTTVLAMHEFLSKLLPSDGASGDSFGSAVAAIRDVVVIGSPLADPRGNSSGAAYIYTATSIATQWQQSVKLSPADGAAGDQFGNAVAISGDTVVVAAKANKPGSFTSGSVYVFDRSGTNWPQTKKLAPFDGANSDEFGYSVSIDKDTLVVGARADDDAGSSSGGAYIYARNQGGSNNWGLVKKIVATNAAAGDEFGFSVSVSDDLVLVGAHARGAGAAYLFGRNQGGSNNWGQIKMLVSSDGLSSDNFGWSVGVYGDAAVVGAPNQDQLGNDTGAAYVFQRDFGGANNWGQLKKLVPPSVLNNDEFGYSVSISRDKIVVGQPFAGFDNQSKYGTSWAYVRNLGGTDNWGVVQKLDRSDPANNDQFGIAVGIGQDTAVVGVNMDDDRGGDSGSAYIYRLKWNNAPQLVIPIPDQLGATNVPFSLTLASGTFSDPDIPETLTLSASLSDGSPLPGWLTFSPSNGTFSGTPPTGGVYAIRVTATDLDGASASSTFNLTVPGVTVTNQAAPPLILTLTDNGQNGEMLISYLRPRNANAGNYSLEVLSGGSWLSAAPMIFFEQAIPIDSSIEKAVIHLEKELDRNAWIFRMHKTGN